MKIGVMQVILWTFGVRFAFVLSVLVVAALSPGREEDFVVQVALLSACNLGACALFASRRQGRSWSETFAIRPTSFWLVLLAAALGVAAYLPADALAGSLERFWPMDESARKAHESWFMPRSFSYEVVLFAFVVWIGPFSEDLLFRGALYTGLRPAHRAAYAVWTTGLLFTIVHDPRAWPAILPVAMLLGVVRALSGSLWPPLFLHIAFNATGFVMRFPHPLGDPSLGIMLGLVAVSAVIVGATIWVGRRSGFAQRARQVDLEPDPGLRESHP